MTRDEAGRAVLRETFREYRRTGDRRLRNELIEAHRGLAAHQARRYADAGEPFDDLFQVACLGMLKAVQRFDPDRGVEFSTFAVATVDGELKRHFRDHTWSVNVPRRPQELHLRVRAATAAVSQRLGRSPTVGELADYLDVGEDDVLEAMEVGRAYRSASLDAPAGDEDGVATLGTRSGTDDPGYAAAETRADLDRLLAGLPERERRIVRLRFYSDLTQSEIAERVGVSQMHVSRLLARSLGTLRELAAQLAQSRGEAEQRNAGPPLRADPSC